MRMPDFLVLGAAKSGTISLYHYLDQHPAIFMSPVNEANFFALETADFNREYLGPVDRFYLDRHCVKDLQTYRALFIQAREDQVVGESSPLYLYAEDAASRIYHHLPDARFIAILRNPTDRAFANFRHFRRAGIEPIPDFREALEAEPDRISQGWGPWPFWHYREMGFYARQLARYLKYFRPDQFFIETFDTLQNNPGGLMARIFKFLEVDPDFIPDTSTRHNIGGQPRHRLVHELLTTASPPLKFARRLVPGRLRARLRAWILDWNMYTPGLEMALRRELDLEYADDIRQLSTILGKDLSSWLPTPG